MILLLRTSPPLEFLSVNTDGTQAANISKCSAITAKNRGQDFCVLQHKMREAPSEKRPTSGLAGGALCLLQVPGILPEQLIITMDIY